MDDNADKQRLFIMRHAERMDFTFGDWTTKCFDENGKYSRYDLNMPLSVPPRNGGPNDYLKDCPLTNIGCYQAILTGEALKHKGIKFTKVFCSPALRCVQTCSLLLKSCGQSDLPINIEPTLFEWLHWYNEGLPVWLSLDELIDLGYPIAKDYKPVVSLEEMTDTSETLEDYYTRSYLLCKDAAAKYEGNLLFVAHGSTLDTCSRQLLKQAPRGENEFMEVIYQTPYASIVALEKAGIDNWNLVPPPICSGSVMHTNNKSYNWELLKP